MGTVVASTNPATMYAGVSFGTDGVHKSTDGGATWTELTSVLPTNTLLRVNLAIAPSDPLTVYAALVAVSNIDDLLGLYKTIDGGTNWSLLTATSASCSPQCWYNLSLAVKPDDPNTVFFGGVDLFRSIDGGATFAAISFFPAGPVHADQHFFAFDPLAPTTVFVGHDGGIYKSTDTGDNWTTLNTNLALTQFYPGISLHPTDANVVMGGTQDNGTPLAPVGGSTVWNDVTSGDGGFTAIDFLNPTVRYGENQWSVGSGFSGPRRSDGGSFVLKVSGGITTSDRA